MSSLAWMNTLPRTGIDYCVLGDHLVGKRQSILFELNEVRVDSGGEHSVSFEESSRLRNRIHYASLGEPYRSDTHAAEPGTYPSQDMTGAKCAGKP
jgi:hypothetical protein